MPTGKKLQSWRKLMPSHSPRFPPITEIIVHTERPVFTVLETSTLQSGVTMYRLECICNLYLFIKLTIRYGVSSEVGTLYLSLFDGSNL